MNILRADHRVVSLDMILKGLTETIDILKYQIDEIDWYDADWFMEECEPIYGLAFIAFQNYINGSIKDFTDSLEEKKKYYKFEHNPNANSRTKIELIIGLANYIKHKEEGLPHTGTKEILEYFNLNYDNVIHLDNSPIFQGLTILNEEWDLFKIKEIVTEWREFLWLHETESVKKNE